MIHSMLPGRLLTHQDAILGAVPDKWDVYTTFSLSGSSLISTSKAYWIVVVQLSLRSLLAQRISYFPSPHTRPH